MGLSGVIFDISHYMVEDGPGIRTNVFFKGCPLRCKWCSNAYGLDSKMQLAYVAGKCVGCGRCLPVCPSHAISLDRETGRTKTDFALCARCMNCAAACPSGRAPLLERSIPRKRFFRSGEGPAVLPQGPRRCHPVRGRDPASAGVCPGCPPALPERLSEHGD